MAAVRMRSRVSSLLGLGFRIHLIQYHLNLSFQYSAGGDGVAADGAIASSYAQFVEDVEIEEVHQAEDQQDDADLVEENSSMASRAPGTVARVLKARVT